MNNLNYWDQFKSVPDTAKKEIIGGRLKGMTDISPIWRLKALTEAFGPVGFGWKYEIVKEWLEKGHGDTVSAFVNINLYVNDPSLGWSAAIPGTGGSAFVAVESKGAYTSDECFKMALTDALSVSMKALGVAADVYWAKDTTKYNPTAPAYKPVSTPLKPVDEWSDAEIGSYVFKALPTRGGAVEDYPVSRLYDAHSAGTTVLKKIADMVDRSETDRQVARRAAELCALQD